MANSKRVAMIVGGGLLLVTGCASFWILQQPDTYRVERSRELACEPAVAFAQVADFHAWAGWSPWDELDPAMERTFRGPDHGAGAIYEWRGNDDVGQGRMTITDAVEAQKIVIALEFVEPFPSTSTTTFDFEPTSAGTRVTWTMDGHSADFLTKIFMAMADMDAMIGADFDAGLANLERIVEGG